MHYIHACTCVCLTKNNHMPNRSKSFKTSISYIDKSVVFVAVFVVVVVVVIDVILLQLIVMMMICFYVSIILLILIHDNGPVCTMLGH